MRGSILNGLLNVLENECERLSAAERRAAKGQAGARHQEEARGGSGTVQRTASAVRVPPTSASAMNNFLFSLSLCLSFVTFRAKSRHNKCDNVRRRTPGTRGFIGLEKCRKNLKMLRFVPLERRRQKIEKKKAHGCR